MQNISPVTRDNDIEKKNHTHLLTDITDFPNSLIDGGSTAANSSLYSLTDSADYPLMALSLYGKSVQNGTPAPDAPVDIVSVGDSSFDIISKGTADFSMICFRGKSGNIITQQPVSMVGKIGDILTAEVKTTGSNLTYQWQWSTDNGTTWRDSVIKTATYRVTVLNGYNGYLYRCVVTNGSATEISNIIKLYVVSDSCDITKLIIDLSESLCGIPVASGGNYTDANGQMWVCDELVYNADGTGKIIKRTAKIDSYSGESILTTYISSTGELTTGATIIYQLAEPQEINLTTAEMSALRSLQTFEGLTNISNSADAEMAVKYCTNKALAEYVKPLIIGLQAQIDTLSAAILSLGGNV